MIDSYEKDSELLEDLRPRLKDLVEQLLKDRGLHVHSVECRVKEADSLQRKLQRSPGKYQSLSEVTDFMGLRIVTHYVDEVDAVAEMIEQEFLIDRENSVDRRATMDPDRFGYVSLHYVASLPAARTSLTEYRRFEMVKFEIQIRSILQHAWAEIEHDLGYKAQFEVPRSVRRRFSRLAGLLEVGDEEFVHIRDDLRAYAEELKSLVTKAPDSVPIDQESVRVFTDRAQVVRSIDKGMAAVGPGKPSRLLPPDAEGSGADARALVMEQLRTIGDVKRALAEHRDDILNFGRVALERVPHEILPRGISLLFLGYILAAKRGRERAIEDLLMQARDWPLDAARESAKEILATLQEAGVAI